MKAALCKSLDGPEAIVLAELPDPAPGAGEARDHVDPGVEVFPACLEVG